MKYISDKILGAKFVLNVTEYIISLITLMDNIRLHLPFKTLDNDLEIY